jgi:hypothetical protein
MDDENIAAPAGIQRQFRREHSVPILIFAVQAKSGSHYPGRRGPSSARLTIDPLARSRLPAHAIYRTEYNATARRMMFDAQCDFAAVAYGIDDDPDRLLLDFAEDLRGSGRRVAGIIQLSRARPPGNHELDAVVSPSVERVNLGHHHPGAALGCRPDPSRLASVARVIGAAIAEGVDLVVINRFGKLEAEGQGLIHLIKSAVHADIPVVTAVPEYRFAAWLNYSGGMSVGLRCHRAALDHWWRLVARGAPGRIACATFCEIAK